MTRSSGNWRLLAYGLPGLPLAALGLPLYVYLPAFYADDLGLSLSLVGAMLLLARGVDTFTDPLIGIASDYLPTRWGRRMPWIIAGAPLLMLGSWMLFVPGDASGGAYLFVWSLLTYFGWTLIILPYTALGAEISNDYHERSRITAAREGFVIFGTLLAVAIPGLLEWRGASRAAALEAMAWFLLISLPLALLGLLAAVREPEGAGSSVSLANGWRLLRDNRPFRRLIVAYLMNGLANGLPASLFLLFVAHVLGAREWSGLFLAIYFLSGVASLPLWLLLARRFGKHRVWIGSMFWASLVFVWAPFLGDGDVWWFALICLLSGASLGVDQALPASMQADVVDEDTAAGGGGRAGLYFGLWSMATKLALALAVGIAFPLLDLAGFDAQRSSGAGLQALALLYGGLPVLFKIAATFAISGFPLDETRQRELRKRIGSRGAKGVV